MAGGSRLTSGLIICETSCGSTSWMFCTEALKALNHVHELLFFHHPAYSPSTGREFISKPNLHIDTWALSLRPYTVHTRRNFAHMPICGPQASKDVGRVCEGDDVERRRQRRDTSLFQTGRVIATRPGSVSLSAGISINKSGLSLCH